MKFCKVCDNMLYINVDTDTDGRHKLTMQCKNCSYSEIEESDDAVVIDDNSNFEANAAYIDYINNPYLIHDPTIPRLKTVPCDNASCSKPDTKDNDIMYIKYDMNNNRYLYICRFCNHHWITKNT